MTVLGFLEFTAWSLIGLATIGVATVVFCGAGLKATQFFCPDKK